MTGSREARPRTEEALGALPFPTTDARKWAAEFVRLHGGDEGLMLSWFANAIEHGRGPAALPLAAPAGLRSIVDDCARYIASLGTTEAGIVVAQVEARLAALDPAHFDEDGAPFPAHVLDGDCWCDPHVEAIHGRNHPAAARAEGAAPRPEPTGRHAYKAGSATFVTLCAVCGKQKRDHASPETSEAATPPDPDDVKALDPARHRGATPRQEVARLRRQNHEAAEARDRQMASMERKVARYENARARARDLVRGSPVDWSTDAKAQEPDGWWSYQSESVRNVLTAAILDRQPGELDATTRELIERLAAMLKRGAASTTDLIEEYDDVADEARRLLARLGSTEGGGS